MVLQKNENKTFCLRRHINENKVFGGAKVQMKKKQKRSLESTEMIALTSTLSQHQKF